LKRSWSEDLLQSLNKKVGRKISRGSIQKLASGVNASTTKSDQQLRQLIQQVSKIAGVSVSESTTRDLIRTIKNNQIQPGNIMSLLKQMKK
jgi:hypothetical protein